MVVYINGAKVIDRKVTNEDLNVLEDAIRGSGFNILELS